MKVEMQNTQISSLNPEFFQIATADSFEELAEIMPNLGIPKGKRVRVVMQLNAPVAPAFDLPGAELIFEAVMPEGLTLVDVWGEGWSTAVVEMEADPAWLVPIGSYLAIHWVALALAAIGLVILGVLIAGVAITVTGVIERLPPWGWVAIGSIAIITVGGVIYLLTRR